MKTLRKFLLVLALVLAFVASAWDAGGKEEAVGSLEPLMKNEGRSLHQRGAKILGFFLLLGLTAYGTFQWQRRRGRVQGASIHVVAVKPLGQREKVAVLDVLGERMVLGITAHRISLLSQGPVAFSKILREEDRTA